MPEEMLGFLIIAWDKLQNFIQQTYVENFPGILEGILISIGMALFVLVIELCYTGWKKSGLYTLLHPTRSTVTDIILFFIHSSSLIILLAILMSAGVPNIIRGLAKNYLSLELGSYLPPLVYFILFLVILDFFNYWQHWLLHQVPFLWHIHKMHHSAMEFNTITVLREHPLDKALNSLMTLLPALILGIPVAQYPIFITLYGTIGYLKHSRIPWKLGWFGKYIIQSPRDHWIHHSHHREHYDHNYANVFAFWDHLFGTYYKGNKVNTRIGISKSSLNRRGFLYDLIICEWDLIKDSWCFFISPFRSYSKFRKAVQR